MIPFPEIDAIAFRIGPLAIRWYGLAYVAGIGLGWWLLHRRALRGVHGFTPTQAGDLVFFLAIGGVVGGRIGYMLFYNLAEFVARPLSLIEVWKGGMSFHGGLLGVMIAAWLVARARRVQLIAVTDFVIPAVPVGLFFGRLANFVNAELWGRPSDLPWAVLFPGQNVGRHPSQLYEALLEGVVLFLILWPLSAKPRRLGLVSGLFLTLYGVFRVAVEFVREPDAHIGYLAFGWLTMGQVLSGLMIVAGAAILVFANKQAIAGERA